MLFKKFGSIKSKKINQQGIGLGLVISKMIIEKFDGVINFVSKWKKGTSFFFTIEVDDYTNEELLVKSKESEEIIMRKQIDGGQQAPHEKKNRILIADDDEFCLASIGALMRKAEVRNDNIDYCMDGLVAIEHVKDKYTNGQAYSLIFLDFNMPQLGGL